MKKITLAYLVLLVYSYSMAQVKINEICPANADIVYDTTFYNFSPWVELYNEDNTSATVGGFFLSDDPATPLKWKIPAGTTIPGKGFLIVWCDGENRGFHTNFSLDSDGEYVSLSDGSGNLLDELTFPQQFTNISYGRLSDGTGIFQYLKSPSPRKANLPKTATVRLANPEVSVAAGKYSGEKTVTLQHSKQGVLIYFTLDGSEPTETSTKYSQPIVVTKSTTLKAKGFHENFLPSKTEVKTYLIVDREFSLPVVSVSMNPKYLNDDTIGIHVIGKNGIVGSGMDVPVNWNQNWFRHADFEYFKPDGEKIFDESVDLRIYGNWSRRKPQKSFALKARDKYGKNHIDHKLFPLKNIYRYGGFLLRNSGTDWNVAHFRDALMHRLTVGQLDLDYMDYQPVTVFLNGDYWGILNLRERIDADYFESNFGIQNDDLDLLEGSSAVVEGTRTYFNQYYDSLKKINRGDVSAIKFIERYIDVQNFINYQIHNIYIVNTDWPGNNLKFWRQRSNNGKFRWMLWDNDFGFAVNPKEGDWNHLTLSYATDPASTLDHNKPNSTLHLRLLLENPVFKQRFIQTLLTAMQTTYEPNRVLKIINEFANRIEKEMPFHKEKWGGSVADWETQIERLRTFSSQRNPFMKQHAIDFFGLQNEVKINVKVTPEHGGHYKLNGVETQKNLENAFYYRGLPFKTTAIANGGFKFVKWKINRKIHTVSDAIPLQSSWKYFDNGSLPAPTWASMSYDDNAWKSGQAQLGYGDGDEITKVSYGPSSSNKYVTTYFRKEINIADITKIEDFKASCHYDDGAIVYVNGVEVFRANMPTGDIGYSTLSLTAISAAQTTTFYIDKSLFVQGKNVIAVEVHQGSITSSDLSFDFSLTHTEVGDYTQTESTSITIENIAFSDVTLEAVFEPVNRIVINEFCSANSQLRDDFGDAEDWIELFNAGNVTVDIGNFFITDDLGNKTKFKIPSGGSETIMQPGDYRLLWADNEPNQGGTHLNFKLADEGEAIGLYFHDGQNLVKLDEVVFGFQMEDQSWSRVPNGTGVFGLTRYTTPLDENTPVLGVTGNEGVKIAAYPNPTNGELHLILESGQNNATLFNLYGKAVKNFSVLPDNAQVDLGDVPAGVYLLKVQSGKKTGYIRIVKH
jgi:hypothetical protein